MLKGDSTFTMLIVAAILALGVGYYVPKAFVARPAEPPKNDMTENSLVTGAAKAATSKPEWAASAPGRVEPAGGEARIGAQVPGRVVEVLVAANDKVAAGDLLVRLEDDDLLPRIHAAAAEAAVRKRERDSAEATGKPAQDRRAAEDTLATAERQLAQARDDLDRTSKQRRDGTGSARPILTTPARPSPRRVSAYGRRAMVCARRLLSRVCRLRPDRKRP